MILTLIGSRTISRNEEVSLMVLAEYLFGESFVGRSGGAAGSDQSLEDSEIPKSSLEIYLPWDNFRKKSDRQGSHFILPEKFENYGDAVEIARSVHPLGKELNGTILSFHARNVYQALGKDLSTKSDICICCSDPVGKTRRVYGGTSTAVNILLDKNVNVFNIRVIKQLFELLDELKISLSDFNKMVRNKHEKVT